MSVQQFHDISVECENITEYRSLRRGDQIAVEGEMAGVDYYHHGIFLGHEKGVADFGGNNKRDARPRILDLLHFTGYGRRRLVRVVYPDGQCLPPEIAAENAEKLVAEPNRWGPYDVLSNNCEHFATKCKTGIAVSKQVIQKIRDYLSSPVALVGYAAASSAMAGSLGSFD